MAAPRQQSRGRGGAPRPSGRNPQYDPLEESNPWKKYAWVAGVAALAIGLVAGDRTWMWRDSLRRLAHGEEIPAFRAGEWVDTQGVREDLADSLRGSELAPSVEDRDACRELALYALVSAAGDEVISQGGARMGALMEELCLDFDWLEEIVYTCPLAHAEKALPILAHIYGAEKRKMAGVPANRRLAAALAFEFARAGLDKMQAHKVFLFYASSGQKHWLNKHFSELSLWEMRVIASRFLDEEWSKEEVLTWFQRNTRLPARGYASLGSTLGSRETTLFGEPVDTPAFYSLYRDSSEGGIASVYEASDCSSPLARAHYAATAACANGVPALVLLAKNGAAACLVDVMGRWEASAPIEAGMGSSWSIYGQDHPDFVMLAAALWQEKDKALASARLAQLGQFFYDTGNLPHAHSCFREALKQCPQNYAVWAAFHACGAPQEEIAAAAQHFEAYPGVAAALTTLAAGK